MIRTALASLVFIFSIVAQAQTGSAVANGTCNLANSGNNNTKVVINCGIGKEQGRKIIELLNKALASKDITVINAKLDELLAVASKPVQTQNCSSLSNCVQGNNYGPMTLNQYGAPKLLMTDDQQKAITDAMRPYAGLKFTIMRHDATPDSSDYADKIRDALKNAGLICTMDMTGMEGRAGQGIPPGVSVEIGSDEIPAATTLANTMKSENLIQAPLPAGINKVRSDAFDITVAPNR